MKRESFMRLKLTRPVMIGPLIALPALKMALTFFRWENEHAVLPWCHRVRITRGRKNVLK